jgi:HlyD family secretion protein
MPEMHRRAALAAALGAVAIGLLACGDARHPAWSGYVEGEYVHVASPVGGTLDRLSVRDGDVVGKGAALFTLDAVLERAAREEARARLLGAEAQAADTTKGRRADEIAVTQAQRAQAAAQAALAQAELARQQQLFAQNFISKAALDDARTAMAQTQARVAELDAALAVARLPARQDERLAAEAQAEAARQALHQSQWREQQTQVSAPADAQVADTYFRVGEYVPAGQPVLALLPAGQVKARFFVPEAELGRLAIGQPVSLHCDGCGAPIAARISFIATRTEYTPPVIYSNEQRARLVFMVEARPQQAADAARLKPGQPLDVRRAANESAAR